MSVVVIVKVSEGLVLGADSAATISQVLPDGRNELIKTYFNARKLMQVGDFPIGILTWGSAFVGQRTIESLVREWEYDCHWKSIDGFKENHPCSDNNSVGEYKVEICALELQSYLRTRYLEEVRGIDEARLPILGVIVAGYSEKVFFPEIWSFVFPLDQVEKAVHENRPDQNGVPDFGANWYGATDALVRLHFGRDDAILKRLSGKFEVPEDDIQTVLADLEYPIPFPVMPLQDAIEYANYLLTVAIGRYKFVAGPELVGGAIEIAAITQGEFEWISQKKRSLTQGGIQ